MRLGRVTRRAYAPITGACAAVGVAFELQRHFLVAIDHRLHVLPVELGTLQLRQAIVELLVALLKQGENGGDEVRGKRARAEKADPDQGKADSGTGQAQHKRTSE